MKFRELFDKLGIAAGQTEQQRKDCEFMTDMTVPGFLDTEIKLKPGVRIEEMIPILIKKLEHIKTRMKADHRFRDGIIREIDHAEYELTRKN